MIKPHKKKNNISIAIVVLNLLIVAIVILMIILAYIHLNGSNSNTEAETTTASETSATTTTEATTTTTASMTKVSTTTLTADSHTEEETDAPSISTFNKEFFDEDFFIGDSIFTGLTIYDYISSANVFAEKGLNPESIQTYELDGVTLSEKLGESQPRNIYIMLGTNGLAFMDSDYMVTAYLNLIAMIENACPTAHIVVITIPPVTADHEAEGKETMSLVNEYNKKLKKMCEDGGYKCVDLCETLKDSNGYFSEQYAEQDGLHFLGPAYIAMFSLLEETMSE